jgi:hypothetical protein
MVMADYIRHSTGVKVTLVGIHETADGGVLRKRKIGAFAASREVVNLWGFGHGYLTEKRKPIWKDHGKDIRPNSIRGRAWIYCVSAAQMRLEFGYGFQR